MESKKRNKSASSEKKLIENGKIVPKCKCLREKKKKEETIKVEPQDKDKSNRASMIPVLKCDKIDLKSIIKEQKQFLEPSKSPCSCPCAKKQEKAEEYEIRLKILEEKEKSIAEYYQKIEDTLRKLMVEKNEKENADPVNAETPQSTFARKMTSDPEVFRKGKWQNKILSDFENNVEEISSIWLKTSADLFRTLKNLKKNASLDPMEFEIENEKIQVAIKQAKSLTLLKTKSVIAEAKKLYHHKEMIRTELESLLSTENVKLEFEKCSFSRGEDQEWQDNSGKKEADGTGDSSKQIPFENIKVAIGSEVKEKEEYEPVKECAEEKPANSGETTEKPTELKQFSCTPSEIIAEEVEALAAELAKKNETITSLNNRIFELQKTCNEHLHKYNQLQSVLTDFQEKIQWNQVLWKQIGKLKERILGLQQSNKQLEAHKKELESKICKLDKELERLIKLNHLLNQKKYSVDAQECSGTNCRTRNNEFKEGKYPENMQYSDEAQEKSLSDKQSAINQLKSVLNAMKDQENFAQNQIAMFQSKIEALEKKS